ncbi:hypothetical protein [Hydrogenophaga pseudoflava]|uniref:Lipase (Class 3) n=1 Tax=Hydrogenophaga pseudoflava TaxID=47421 RepID=A0A4P6X564_HYDPS|nr:MULTISPECIES: hypothetical protein [Comamonadaceae]QBM28921.1 hypothetical protein HPF_14565 [Hydrogenophaga pseudoflava]
MSEQKILPPGPPENPWNRWGAKVGLHLAFWAYPHKDVKKAEEVANYPPPWEHAVPGKLLPADWPAPVKDTNGRLLQDGWNTQHNADGTLENQFMVSINRKTNQISFDFKGSDAWSNWGSDLGNAGASEFAKIQAKAQAAYDYLSQHPDYKHYHFSATGHSLGGGMAQSFALKNNIDVAVYNSLPIARDTRNGDYFKDVGGYEVALARYRASGRVVHDVRTPNDIATHTYHSVMGNHYLGERTGQPHTLLPGTPAPDLLKTALLLSKFGTLPAVAIMGKDHTMGALVDGQQGLSVGPDGRYRIPEGQIDFSEIPAQARARFALLSASPVTKVGQMASADESSPWNRYQIERKDGSRQWLSSNQQTGAVEIEHHGADDQRRRIELNPRLGKEAVFTELDAEGRPVRSEKVSMSGPDVKSGVRLAVDSGKSERQWPSAEQQTQAQRFEEQLGARLKQLGMNERQIDTLAAAVVKECTRFHGQGEAGRFLLSRDASTIALQQVHPPLREFSVADALARSPAEHWAEAVTMNRDSSAETRDDHGGHGMSVPGYSQHVPGHQAVA